MAIEKTLNTRIKLRYDTHDNWVANDPVLLAGEVALTTVTVKQDGVVNTVPSVLIKVGDGTHKYSELDYVFAKAADVVSAAKTEAGLKSFINGVIADAGIATDEALAELAGTVGTATSDIATLKGYVGDKNVSEQITDAITKLDLANTYEAKGEAAKVSQALESYKTTNNTAVTANTNAISAIKDGESIDSFADVEAALAGKQATGDYATKTEAQGYADAKDEAIAAAKKAGDDAQGAVDALAAKVGTVTEGKTVAEMIADAQEAATYDDTDVKADITDLKKKVGDKDVSVQISEALAVETERAEGIEAGLRTDVDAIKADYLKAADKEALQNQINTIINNPDTDKVIDSIAEFTAYVEEHGTIAEGMRTDIDKNRDDIAAAVKDAGDVADGLDKRLQAVESAVGESGSVAGDIADALAEAKKYTDDEVKELADGAVATNTGDIATLKGKVGDKNVSEQITDVTNPLAERVTALEGTDHTHANADVINGITSEKVTAWDGAVQTVTAGTGLTATKTGTDVAIAFDDNVTFIFNCGGAN